MRTQVRLAVLLAASLLLTACVSSHDKSKQLARVAKDWCLTIRASQVIPVYPLTRDLQPGDVFLTTTPIGSEVELFEEKGFLPLDIHMVRLPVNDEIKAFYGSRLADGKEFPTSIKTWDDLPAAAFPTYSFEVSRSGGLNLAIPIEGVPVGFNYLGAAAATGTVTLKNCQTMGLDLETLAPLLADWEKDNQGLLSAYATDPSDSKSQAVYVRVVTRIYRAGSVSVALNDADRSGAQVAAGLELPTPEPGAPSATSTAAEQYDEVASKLNTALLPQFGGKVRLVKVARRSVMLDEDFPAPMVIGYLAYDCLILPGGVLSAPMPTYQRITGTSIAAPGVFNTAPLIEAWYTADEAPRTKLINDWIDKNMKAADGTKPSTVDFLSQPKYDAQRRRMMRDLGIIPH
jgi:hypothetical protein